MTNSESFKFKSILAKNTNNTGILNIQTAIPLNCLSNFWNTLEIPLINCEINLMSTWSANCIICKADRAIAFAIADKKL